MMKFKKMAAVILMSLMLSVFPYSAYAEENEQSEYSWENAPAVITGKTVSGSFTVERAEKYITSEKGRKAVRRAIADAAKDTCIPVPDKLVIGKGKHTTAVRYKKVFYDNSSVIFPVYGEEGLYGLLYEEFTGRDGTAVVFRPLPAYLLKYKNIVPYTIQPNTWFHYHVVTDSNEFFSVSTDTPATSYYVWNDEMGSYDVIARTMQDEYADRLGIMSEGLSYELLSEMNVINTSECAEKVFEIDASELGCNEIRDGGIYFITDEKGSALEYDVSSHSYKAAEYSGNSAQKFTVRKSGGKYTITPYAEKDISFNMKKSNEFYISCTFYGKTSCKITSSGYLNMAADGGKIGFYAPDSYSSQNWYFTEAEKD